MHGRLKPYNQFNNRSDEGSIEHGAVGESKSTNLQRSSTRCLGGILDPEERHAHPLARADQRDFSAIDHRQVVLFMGSDQNPKAGTSSLRAEEATHLVAPRKCGWPLSSRVRGDGSIGIGTRTVARLCSITERADEVSVTHREISASDVPCGIDFEQNRRSNDPQGEPDSADEQKVDRGPYDLHDSHDTRRRPFAP